MKLSEMRPDWKEETQNSLDPELAAAVRDHTQAQGPSPAAPADQPYEKDPRPLHPDPNEFKVRPMNKDECIEYAKQGTILYLGQRITEINEAIANLKEIGSNDTLDEREVAMMLITELERVKANVPGYMDPSHSQTNPI